MLLIPSLVHTLGIVRASENRHELIDRRWFRVLQRRFVDLGVNLMRLEESGESELVLAGRLLDDPIIKAFNDLEETFLSADGGADD